MKNGTPYMQYLWMGNDHTIYTVSYWYDTFTNRLLSWQSDCSKCL